MRGDAAVVTRENPDPVRSAASAALTAVAFAIASLIASRFADESGASYLFPPAAVMMVGGAIAGWWGLLGVLIGHLATPWGAGSTAAGVAAFSIVHGATTAVAVVALHEPRGGTPARLRRVVGYGAVLAPVVSVVLGVAFFALLGRIPADPAAIALLAGRWLVADVVAALVVGLPLLVMVSPRHALGPKTEAALRKWIGDRNAVLQQTAMVLCTWLLAVVITVSLESGFPHWLAVLLVAPVSYAAWTGGVGAAIVTNGVAVVGWIALALAMVEVHGPAVLEPLYATVTLLSAGALVGGLAVGANRFLLERIRTQRSDLEEGFAAIVSSLSAAIEAKDPLTDGHLHRVADLAVTVGAKLGLEGEDLDTLGYAALLHDIGKIGVPEAVLNKPGPLSPSERDAIEKHVEIGVRILEPVKVLAPVLPLVKYHQERWDGLTEGVRYPGYFGLVGERIPLGSRILAVVDAWDAMTNDRPYRRGMPIGVAMAELRAEAGRQFDPAVVSALLAVIEHRSGEIDVGDLRKSG